jgi:hypothetical protein
MRLRLFSQIKPRRIPIRTAFAGGLAAVAIRAADHAFRDFSFERTRRHAADDESAHAGTLRSGNVIEVEDNDIVFAAIDTWVFSEMFEDDRSIAFRISEMQRIPPRVVRAGSASIILAHKRQLARLAVRTGAAIFLPEEFIERFFLFTAWTNFHMPIVSKCCANTMAQASETLDCARNGHKKRPRLDCRDRF